MALGTPSIVLHESQIGQTGRELSGEDPVHPAMLTCRRVGQLKVKSRSTTLHHRAHPIRNVILDPCRSSLTKFRLFNPLEEPQYDNRSHTVRQQRRLLAVDVEIEVDLSFQSREVLVANFEVVI